MPAFVNFLLFLLELKTIKTLQGLLVENNPENGITLGEEEHKLGIHASSTRQVFFNETLVPLRIFFRKEEMDLKSL